MNELKNKENEIQIVNWLLTRNCNLRCDYCRIVRDYETKPKEYPDMSHYFKNEMSTEMVISGLNKLKKHNPYCFHLLYGGEPLLRKDLYKIINHCNDNDILYTIISNVTDQIQPLVENLIKNVNHIEGFTASIDPIIYQNVNNDIFKKSWNGLNILTKYSKIIKDVVAEITVTNENLKYLYQLIKELTDRGINSDITFVDISKSPYYDFSNVEDNSILVQQTSEVNDILNKIIDEKLNVHMRDILLPKMYKTLPSELDCELEKSFHNLCVDADSSIRLCLRVRGVSTPQKFNLSNLLDDNGILNKDIKDTINYDKNKFCLKCNHSCYIMSQLVWIGDDNSDSISHSDIRKEK
jgi:MoaA/NifB/PqqE/SkfB family radical SAM enzyme